MTVALQVWDDANGVWVDKTANCVALRRRLRANALEELSGELVKDVVAVGQKIRMLEDNTVVFEGLVYEVDRSHRRGEPESCSFKAYDMLIMYDRHVVYRSYPTGTKAGEIIRDLASLESGVDVSNVDDGDSLLSPWTIENQKALDVMKSVARGTNYWLRMKPGMMLYFKPKQVGTSKGIINDTMALDAEYSEDRWKLKNRVIYVGADGEILADVSEGAGDLPIVVHDPSLTDPNEAQRRANIRLALNKEYGRSLRVTIHKNDLASLGLDLGDTVIIQLPSIGVYDLLDIGVTCDNVLDKIYINGEDYTPQSSSLGNWQVADFLEVEKAGKIVIAVACHNADTTSPAGLLLRIRDINGNTLFNGSDLSNVKVYFSTTPDPPSPDWYKPDYDDSAWANATQLTQYGSGPWGTNVSNWDDPDAWWFWANNEGLNNTPNTQYVWFRITIENGIKFVLLGIEYEVDSFRRILEFGGRKELLEDWLDEKIGGDVSRRFGQLMTLPEEASAAAYSLEAAIRIQAEPRYSVYFNKPPLSLYNAQNIMLDDSGYAQLVSGATSGSFEAQITPPSELFVNWLEAYWRAELGAGSLTVRVLRGDDSEIAVITDQPEYSYRFPREPVMDGGLTEKAASGWGASGATVSDARLGIIHAWCLKLLPNTLGTDGEIFYPSAKNWGKDLSWAKWLRLYLYGDEPNAQDIAVKIRLHTSATDYFEATLTVKSKTWRKYEIDMATLTQVGTPSLSNINWISIISPYTLLIDSDYVFLPATRELLRLKFELSRVNAADASPKVRLVKLVWKEET